MKDNGLTIINILKEKRSFQVKLFIFKLLDGACYEGEYIEGKK